jgi:quinol monooxygenase YgiN
LRRTLLAPTRAEQGCSTYDLHRCHGGPGLFVFIEAWDNRPLRDAHMTSPHLETFGDKQDATIETSELLTVETV